MPLNPPAVPEDDFIRLRVKLGQLRAERGFTYDTLAAEAGISRSILVALETGKARNGRPVQASLAVWWRIAKALDLSLAELLSVID